MAVTEKQISIAAFISINSKLKECTHVFTQQDAQIRSGKNTPPPDA